MEEDDFNELKIDTLEVFEECFQDTVEYHVIQDPLDPEATNPSTVNSRFGFVDTVDTCDVNIPTTTCTELFFSNKAVALDKTILKASSDDFRADFDATIFIPTLQLENCNIVLQRERSFFRFKDGMEYQLEAIQPIPRMFGSSLVHKVVCTKRKPIEDNNGVN